MDFHDNKNKMTYVTREADASWHNRMKEILDIRTIKNAADIGCGGGIYSKALIDLGVENVTAIDSSHSMLEGARENCQHYKAISFQSGTAEKTRMESNSVDYVLERALIHHIKDLLPSFLEAYRILNNQGVLLIQDRTPADCLLPGGSNHIRGYIFEMFPQLAAIEQKRRHHETDVKVKLEEADFKNVQIMKLWETRKRYPTKQQLLMEIMQRTGKSILHELTDLELSQLTQYIDERLADYNGVIEEKDCWTIWTAEK